MAWTVWRSSASAAGQTFRTTRGGFIALHIVNAELNTTMSVVNDVTRFVDGCVQVVEYFTTAI